MCVLSTVGMHVYMCVHMLLCEGESRDWHWASSSIAVYLILLRQIVLLNQEVANLSRFDYPTSLWDPHVSASLLWYTSTGHHTCLCFLCELWELGLGIGLGSSRLLVQSSLLTELPPQSHYQKVQWLFYSYSLTVAMNVCFSGNVPILVKKSKWTFIY